MTSPRSTEFDLFKTLDALIDAWCERRALKPLHYILRAYPAVIAHTDQKFELLDALKDVKGLCREDLTLEERQLVTKAHDFLEQRLDTRVT
jgi:hypothetical protein